MLQVELGDVQICIFVTQLNCSAKPDKSFVQSLSIAQDAANVIRDGTVAIAIRPAIPEESFVLVGPYAITEIIELSHDAEGRSYSSFSCSQEKTQSAPQPTSAPFLLGALT